MAGTVNSEWASGLKRYGRSASVKIHMRKIFHTRGLCLCTLDTDPGSIIWISVIKRAQK